MSNAYSIAHLTALGLPPPQLIEAASNAGARYVGLRLNRTTNTEPLYDLINDRPLMRETRARLIDLCIEVWDIEAARMDPLRDHHYYREFLEAGAELGARYVLAQLPDPDRNRAVDRFGALCEMAKPLGLNVSLEFVSWTETPNLVEAARVLQAVNQPNASMLVDFLHFDRSHSSLELLRSLPRDWFKWAHVCDAPADHPPNLSGLIYTARCERLLPGEGGIDVKGILKCLPEDIVYALEIPGEPTVKKIGYRNYVHKTVELAQFHLNH